MTTTWRRLGWRLRRLREAQGLSRRALAWKVGLSTAFVRKIEQGQRWPSLPNLEKLARALDTRLRIDLVARRRER